MKSGDDKLAELEQELARLRLVEQRFEYLNRLVSDYAYSFVVEADMTMRGDWISESFSRVFGWTLPEIDARGGWQSVVFPDDLAVAFEHVRRVLANEPDACEMRFVTKQGKPRWLRDFAVPVWDDEQQRVVRIWGTSQDITEARRQAEELEQNRRFLESVLTSIQEGISVLDRDLKIVHVNDVMRRWYRDSLPLEGKTCFRAYHGLEQPCEPCPTIRCLQSGRTERNVVPGLPGSEAEWLELFAYPHRGPTGEIDMVVEFVRDITPQRKLEQQLLQAQKMEAVGRLAGGVAHDFNNLLSVIIGRCDLLMLEAASGGPAQAELAEILAAAQRAETLTRQLLAFSRRQVLQPTVLNLNSVVGEMSSLLQRLIGEDVELAFLPERGLGNTRIDRNQLEQVLMNLVVNSRDAMPRGGKLTIETANVELDAEYAASHHEVEPGRYVMVSVSDTGAGMDEATRARIFEPFFTTKELGRGTGLGLSTVHGIVRQSGGHIWVYSEPGRGTTFKIYLPRVDEALGKQPSGTQVGRRGRGESILVVEDNQAVRTFLSKALEHLGYRVMAVASAEQALELAAAGDTAIDLLITDVVLTGLDGRQLAERLLSARPGLKVLYISGYTTNAIVQHGVLEDGLHFLAKPFTLEALAAKLGEILGA